MTELPALPSNVEAEQALLGCILFDNDALDAADNLEPEQFYEPVHQRMFALLRTQVGEGGMASALTVHKSMHEDPALHALGGVRYLADMLDRAPPPRTAKGYADHIADLHTRRECVRIGEDMTSAAMEQGAKGEDVLALGEDQLFRLAEHGDRSGGFAPFESAIDGALAMTEAAYARDGALAGLSTGLIDLDAKLGGLHPSDLVILAGRPSMGKTALATNVAWNAARAGAKVGFFSLEMSKDQLAQRILADVSGVSSDRMRKGEIDAREFAEVRDAGREIRSATLEIDDTGGLSIARLAARARRLKRKKKGLDLLVIDYLQLVTTDHQKGEGRVQEVSRITQALKALAKELAVPVLALSQLSRAVEQREDKKPQLSDLRESGSIEQDADVVMFVYRESYYLGRAEPKLGSPQHLNWEDEMMKAEGKAEVIIGKQRHGPIGSVNLAFNDGLTRFGNLAREGQFSDRRDVYSAMEPA